MLAFTGLLLLLAALPDLLQGRPPLPSPATTLASMARVTQPAPLDPNLRPLALLEEGLMERLDRADQSWIPRAEPLPEGGTRYVYRRRVGDPELSLSQIRALIANPPSHQRERRSIVALLTKLERVGAGVGLIEPIKPGAAAEWDPQARTLRLRPDVPEQGSLEFARVLNHEAIHVAQSCAAGGVGARPRPLGVLRGLPSEPLPARKTGQRHPGIAASIKPLQDPVYADLSPWERRMEQEAYALQNNLDVGLKLLERHCRVL